MIKPTVGRRVHYWPNDHDIQRGDSPMSVGGRDQPCDAGIAFVHSGDTLVNLTVADHNGVMHRRTSVRLLQEGDAAAPGEAHATWMPYQLGQAKQQADVGSVDSRTAIALAPAIAQLRISAENCETNAPIHEAEGNTEQAALSRANAESYRAAIAVLGG